MVFRQTRKKRASAKRQLFSVKKWDPLFIIFEKHLYDFNYESRELFLKGVVDEYIAHLVRQKTVIPPSWRMHLEKSIAEEVSDMLVRKLYGCLTVEEFQARTDAESEPTKKEVILTEKKEARKRYQKLVG